MLKYLFTTKTNAEVAHIWLLILRVALAAFMLTHGLPKLEMLLSGNGAQFADPIGLGGTFSLILALMGEVGGSVLVMLGLGTRIAALPTIVTMSVAAFIVHASDAFATREMALLYLLGFLTILIMGPGRYSLDQLISKKLNATPKKKV